MLKPWLKQQWVLPPKANAEFVCAMETVLEVYARPPDPRRPVVCADEGGKQLIGDVREALPVRPKSPAKEDYEYARHGTANLFMAFEPLTGARHVEVTERKTKADFARLLKRIADEWYPDADRITLVVDNLSTHKPAVLYEPAEARRIMGRLDFVYTPKHGSWLNMAEIELSVLARQCLARRIPDLETLRREVAAWENGRNTDKVVVDWQFTTADARTKLKRLYPVLEPANSGVAEHYYYTRRITMCIDYSTIGAGRPTSLYQGLRRATFADPGWQYVEPVVTRGRPTRASVPGYTFQYMPRIEDADGRVPQTPHIGGLPCSMFDGSVRTIRQGVTEAAFWGAVTPNGGEVAGLD